MDGKILVVIDEQRDFCGGGDLNVKHDPEAMQRLAAMTRRLEEKGLLSPIQVGGLAMYGSGDNVFIDPLEPPLGDPTPIFAEKFWPGVDNPSVEWPDHSIVSVDSDKLEGGDQ